MKKKHLSFFSLFSVLLVFAGHARSQTAAYNYIVTYVPRTTISSASALPTATVSAVNQTVQYFDGLGRPIQTVQTKGSPSQRDLVQPMAYDQFDREAVKYLPYADSVNSTNYGTYKTTAFSDQASFYANPNVAKWYAPGVVTTPYPTANTYIEASPLNRPLEQGFAGDNWQLTGTVGPANPGHTVKMLYASNDASSLTSGDGYWAAQYTVTYSYPTGNYDYRNSLTYISGYPVNTLYVTITKNENWSASQSDTTLNTMQDYKDLFGRIVLKRAINYNIATSTRQVLSTYYVYDNYNNLVYVLPPAANPDGGSISQAVLNNLCYQYRYDGRNRMIYKKIPGKGWQFMVYNNLNQVIATQDSVQRMASPQQVSYTKYDSQARVIITGIYTTTGAAGFDNWSTLQTAANAQTTYWETKSSAGVYSNTTTPTSGATILTINYYDDYNNSGLPSTYTLTSGVSVMTRGLLTSTETAVLNAPTDLLWSAHYYDDLGRNTKSYKQHYAGGHADLSTNNYDITITYPNFVNQADTTIRQHYTKANTTTPKVIITNIYAYDQIGRKLTTWQQFTGATGTAQTPVYISSNGYNQIGQLTSKSTGGSTAYSGADNIFLGAANSVISGTQTITATNSIVMNDGFSVSSGAMFTAQIVGYLQNIQYVYNERGWLTSITPLVTATGTGNYAETIAYNKPTGTITPQYNGNISQFVYNSPYMEGGTPTAFNTVNYTYDNLNRLTQSQSTLAKTDEAITYDVEGNIQGLVRSGTGTNTGTFAYTYPANSNQLTSVTQNSNARKQYGYDGNGNATSDSTTKLLTYNMLNLPMVYTLNGVTKATYYYDADGIKLRDVSTGYGTWDYIDGIVYLNEKISFIQTEEGQAVPFADSTYHYNYNLLDYLGNVRETYGSSSSGAIQDLQENDYYPFGLTVKAYDNSNGNRYLYNKKEEQYDLTNQYDYGARFYDPVIGRWGVVDAYAEHPDQIDLSPYAYVGNNPIIRTDPDGNCFPCVIWLLEAIDAALTTEAVVTATVVTAGAVGTAAIISHAYSGSNPVMQQDATSTVAPQAVVEIRSKNKIPDTGVPNSSLTNPSGTTTKVYGPDGNVVKEHNEGHPGHTGVGANDHVHDHVPKPNPHPKDPKPSDRSKARLPRPNELQDDLQSHPPAPNLPTPTVTPPNLPAPTVTPPTTPTSN